MSPCWTHVLLRRRLQQAAGAGRSLDEGDGHIQLLHAVFQRRPRPGKGLQDVAQRVLAAAGGRDGVVVVLWRRAGGEGVAARRRRSDAHAVAATCHEGVAEPTKMPPPAVEPTKLPAPATGLPKPAPQPPAPPCPPAQTRQPPPRSAAAGA